MPPCSAIDPGSFECRVSCSSWNFLYQEMQKETSEEHNLKYRMKSRLLNANIEGKKT